MGEIISVSVDVQENGIHITTTYRGESRSTSLSTKAVDVVKKTLYISAEEVLLTSINRMLRDSIHDYYSAADQDPQAEAEQ